MSNILRDLLKNKGPIKKIGVIGMGYVGIPSASLFADSPTFEFVWGFQRNSSSSGYKIDMLNRGECPLDGQEPGLESLIQKIVKSGKFRCTSEMSKISDVDAVTIAVETGFCNYEELNADLEAFNDSLKNTGKSMKPGTLVVIESTVTPGTTEGMAREILEEESGMKAGKDFALAHAPERVMPGRLLRNIQEYDRAIGGFDEVSLERAVELYRPVLSTGKVIRMKARAAEVSKTAENALRDLQIAAANELALYCEALGINFYNVKTAIDSLKGEGVTRAVLYPGAGVGGHCLPKDTYHLARALKGNKEKLDFPEHSESLFLQARHINNFMPKHMYHLTLSSLKSAGKSSRRIKVALLGWAYNKNTDDPRNTPAKLFRDLMVDEGTEVKIHDPYVNPNETIAISQDLDSVLSDADVIAIFTAHDDYIDLDLERVKRLSKKERPIIVDGRNIIDPDKALALGFIYRGIGRGDKNGHPVG